MKNKLFSIAFAFTFIAFVSFLTSCNDAPTDIGGNLLKDTVVVSSLSAENSNIIESIESYKTIIKSYTSNTALIGSSGENRAVYLFRVFQNQLPDSIGTVTEEQIISARLVLEVDKYALGDLENGVFSVELREITKYWSKIENDSIKLTTYSNLFDSPADFFGRKIGEFKEQINIASSNSTDEIYINLDKTYIKDILQKENGKNTLVKNEGIAIIPRNDCNIIHQFVTYINSTKKDTMSRLELVYKNLQGGIDTAKVLIANDGLFTSVPNATENQIVIQENVDFRTEIKLDLSKIPKNAGIVKTELILTLDKEKTYNGNEGLDSTIYLGIFENRDKTSPLNSSFYVEGKPDSTGKFIFKSLSGPIQYIIRHGGKGSLILYPGHGARNSYTNNKMDRMVFYGKDADDPQKRPILRIAFSYVETKK